MQGLLSLMARSHPANHTDKGASSADRALSLESPNETIEEIRATLRRLDASLDGLTEAEANARLLRNGANEVAHDKPPHWTPQLLATFKNPFIMVLALGVQGGRPPSRYAKFHGEIAQRPNRVGRFVGGDVHA